MSIISTKRHTSPRLPRVMLGGEKHQKRPYTDDQAKQIRQVVSILNNALGSKDVTAFNYSLSEAFRLIRRLNQDLF